MEESKKFPYKLETGVWSNGKSHPIWCYDKVPAGMVEAKSVKELWYGRPILTECLLEPNKGTYCTDIVRATTINILKERIRQGIPVYVSNTKTQLI